MIHSRQAGMTLIEMLVVLIIAAMALALGFQSLGQWRRANTAIDSLSAQSRQVILTRSWLQASARALHPVEERAFEGERNGWSGVTLQPILATQGGATPMAWELVREAGRVSLRAQENDDVIELPLAGVQQAYFEFVDTSGRSHPQWPPLLGQHDQLPDAVLLHLEDATGVQRIWAASIAGIRNPVMIMYEPETD